MASDLEEGGACWGRVLLLPFLFPRAKEDGADPFSVSCVTSAFFLAARGNRAQMGTYIFESFVKYHLLNKSQFSFYIF